MSADYDVQHAMAVERLVTAYLNGDSGAVALVGVPDDAVPYVRAAAAIVSAVYSTLAQSISPRQTPAQLWRRQMAAVTQHRLNQGRL